MLNFDFNSENSLFIPGNLEARKLIIFFSGTDRKNKNFDFFKVAKNLKYSALLLNNGENEWYQHGIPSFGHTLNDTISRIKQLIKNYNFNEVYCTGMSMGGYGACLYASLLNAKALAFGFDSVLKLPGSRSLKRLKIDTVPELSNLFPILKEKNTDVIHIAGECDALDFYSCCLLSPLPNVKTITITGVGHGVPPFIKKNMTYCYF